ncbi:MAG TPA: hypothetical protein VGO51_06100 [Burkholderiaceae bacterium]|jgi:hypothetical protein|nr:hypothetical protein [Burkholderiaceae bacterium]
MANKEQYDKFADEMARRFEDFTQWAIDNWPNKDFPLLQSDFSESRKEIGHILGARLNESQEAPPPSPAAENSPQYINMNPAPWP